jgi:hypothetical protein
MTGVSAIRQAIDLLHFPSRVRAARAEPLPAGVGELLRILATDEGAELDASRAIGRSPEFIRQAAAFFVEQILLSQEADSYRTLGATPEAGDAELRHNMALLVRWLHPDLHRQRARSIFMSRVLQAWDDLKTPARRAAYDQARRLSASHKAPARGDRKIAAASRPRAPDAVRSRGRTRPAGNRTLDSFLRFLLDLTVHRGTSTNRWRDRC